MILRPYQTDIITQVVKAIREGYKAPLVVAPTGSGKTVIFAHIATGAHKKGKRVLILTHRREILQQTISKLVAFGIAPGSIISGNKTTDNHIQVAMINTVINRLESLPAQDLIIIDEAAHAVSNTWGKVINHFDCLRIGFTATPERLSGEGLIDIFDTMIQGPSVKSLIADGYLSNPRMFCGPNVKPGDKIKITRGDYDKDEQMQRINRPVLIGSVIQHYREKLHGLPVVCFCISINHCHIMEAEFTAAGYKARTVHGGMKRADRESAIQGLAGGTVQVLCSCDVISEGVDIPVIAGAILLRRTKSLALYLQQVGRALRPYPGKTEAIILDHAGCVYDHGHVIGDRTWSLEAKKRHCRADVVMPVVSVCPTCGGVWPGNPDTCPDCGYDLKAEADRKAGRKPPEEIAGILTEVWPEGTAEEIEGATRQALRFQGMDAGPRQKAMIACLYKEGASEKMKGLAEALGYKRGWVYAMRSRLH